MTPEPEAPAGNRLDADSLPDLSMADWKPKGFWTAGPRLALPPQGPHGRPDAVLDLLEPLDLTAGRYQVTDLLRRAYRVMASEAGAAAAEDTVD